VRDILPDETSKRLSVIKKISAVLEKAGYRQVLLPTFENFEYIKNAIAPSLEKETLKFFSPDGEVLVLRPDFTTSVARMAASRMKNTRGPLRLYYSGDVYRIKKFAAETQFHQIGIELIDLPEKKGDQEVLSLVENIMKTLKIKKYSIVANNISYISKLPQKEQKLLHELDFVSLNRFPADNEVVPGDIDYYTGIYFEIYAEGMGYPLGSGGRYDKLLANFHDKRNAVGFALNLSRIMQALEKGS